MAALGWKVALPQAMFDARATGRAAARGASAVRHASAARPLLCPEALAGAPSPAKRIVATGFFSPKSPKARPASCSASASLREARAGVIARERSRGAPHGDRGGNLNSPAAAPGRSRTRSEFPGAVDRGAPDSSSPAASADNCQSCRRSRRTGWRSSRPRPLSR